MATGTPSLARRIDGLAGVANPVIARRLRHNVELTRRQRQRRWWSGGMQSWAGDTHVQSQRLKNRNHIGDVWNGPINRDNVSTHAMQKAASEMIAYHPAKARTSEENQFELRTNAPNPPDAQTSSQTMSRFMPTPNAALCGERSESERVSG